MRKRTGLATEDKRGEMERLPERPKKIVTTPYPIAWQSLLDTSRTPFFLSFHHPTRAAFSSCARYFQGPITQARNTVSTKTRVWIQGTGDKCNTEQLCFSYRKRVSEAVYRK